MDDRRNLVRALGPVGVWSFQFDRIGAVRTREVLAALEEMGLTSLWIPEGSGSKEALSHAGLLLASSRKVVVGTGIANIWARDPTAMANGARLLCEAYPGRFVLGIGVSHPESLPRRGHAFERPLHRMRAYLDAMQAARYPGPEPPERVPVLLAALGPRMLRLAAERAVGAHTYFVPVSHTLRAREALGAGPILAAEQAVVLSSDPEQARRVARDHMRRYMGLANYRNNLLRLGFAGQDVEDEGSDRLVDEIVAWGPPEAILERIGAHLEAGADHVAVQVLVRGGEDFPLDDLRALAPALRRRAG